MHPFGEILISNLAEHVSLLVININIPNPVSVQPVSTPQYWRSTEPNGLANTPSTNIHTRHRLRTHFRSFIHIRQKRARSFQWHMKLRRLRLMAQINLALNTERHTSAHHSADFVHMELLLHEGWNRTKGISREESLFIAREGCFTTRNGSRL